MADPTSRKAKLLGHLRTALSESSAFQTWTGSANATEALARIHVDMLPRGSGQEFLTRAELEALRPYALLREETFSVNQEARPSQADVGSLEGTLSCRFEMDVPPAPDPAATDQWQAWLLLTNPVGAILDDLFANKETSGHLDFNNIDQPEGTDRAVFEDIPDQGDWISLDVMISYGPVR